MSAFLIIILITLLSSVLVSYNNSKVKRNVEHLSNVSFSGITFLLEADRDSYQSNVSLSQIMHLKDKESIQKKIKKGVNDNILQVRQRFDKFKKNLKTQCKIKGQNLMNLTSIMT